MKKAAFRMIPTDRIVRLKVKGRTFSAWGRKGYK
jgi:hypothetical protein